jgi:3-hydroxyisobutyrate dehydrogenase-like beta-hydroxyacid dehydrogenase
MTEQTPSHPFAASDEPIAEQPATTVGFAGVGAMGGLMVERLLAASYSVTVFDLDEAASTRAATAGARRAACPAELARRSDVVFTSLPTPGALVEVVTGPGGVASGLRPGATVIDVGTTDPSTTRGVAGSVQDAGGRYLDAPVSGSVMRAAEGTLTFMVGGDLAALDDARPVLAPLGARVIHCGPTGSGQMAKLANNMLCAATLAAIAETFLTAVKSGLDADVLLEVVRHSSGGSWLLESWVAPTAFADDFTPRFRLDLMDKDVGLFADAAARLDVGTPVCGVVREMLRAARADGLGAEDMTAIVRVYERLAGVRLLEHSRRPSQGVSRNDD